jgi:hypothetical protein
MGGGRYIPIVFSLVSGLLLLHDKCCEKTSMRRRRQTRLLLPRSIGGEGCSDLNINSALVSGPSPLGTSALSEHRCAWKGCRMWGVSHVRGRTEIPGHRFGVVLLFGARQTEADREPPALHPCPARARGGIQDERRGEECAPSFARETGQQDGACARRAIGVRLLPAGSSRLGTRGQGSRRVGRWKPDRRRAIACCVHGSARARARVRARHGHVRAARIDCASPFVTVATSGLGSCESGRHHARERVDARTWRA